MKDSIEFAVYAYMAQNFIRWEDVEEELTHYQRQEDEIDKKDAYAKLSVEAKEIIEVIITAPVDFVESFNSTIPSMKDVRAYIRRTKHWKHKIIDSAFNELKGFVGTFTD